MSRLWRRALYLAVPLAGCGALLGWFLGDEQIGWLIGALVGGYGGLTVGAFAWLFDGPWRGALRCGGLMASLMGLLSVASGREWPGFISAAQNGLGGGLVGGVMGAAFGAFLGWIAGPVFRGAVTEIDKKAAGQSDPKRA